MIGVGTGQDDGLHSLELPVELRCLALPFTLGGAGLSNGAEDVISELGCASKRIHRVNGKVSIRLLASPALGDERGGMRGHVLEMRIGRVGGKKVCGLGDPKKC